MFRRWLRRFLSGAARASGPAGPWGARVERYNLVEPIGEKMMDRVLNQGVSPALALRDAAREIDRELRKN